MSSPAMTVVETNLPDRATAESLARDLLTARLVACANWWPIQSSYWWEDQLITTEEIRLVLKTNPAHATDALGWLAAHHPYDAPWIISRDATSLAPAYITWLEKNLA